MRVSFGLWEQARTKASLSLSPQSHFWVSEVADPGLLSLVLWAAARGEAGRPISSPPFWCQGFYSKGKKFKIYLCAKETAQRPGCQAPLA